MGISALLVMSQEGFFFAAQLPHNCYNVRVNSEKAGKKYVFFNYIFNYKIHP